jgi:site-specific DNA-methyltransferase (adenine-specific)
MSEFAGFGTRFEAEPDHSWVVLGDNLPVLAALPAESVQMIYIDPPFNTGRTQTKLSVQVKADPTATRTGFGGRTYASSPIGSSSYPDHHDDFLGFIEPRLVEARRLLTATGTLYVHLDYREVHYVKVLLDELFSRECFLNEIVWAYDYGARSTRRWPTKHDTVLVYVKDKARYHFDSAEVDREPYMAPGLVSKEKADRGKLPTDVWWHTIVSPTGKEKTGYPTQKPEGVIRRMVLASSRPGDRVIDFFAGSGTLGAVAAATGRRFVIVDHNPEAVAVAERRLAAAGVPYLRYPEAE